MCDKIATDDAELVRAFAREGSEPAFRAIVDRHAGWVYAAAFRQLRDEHLAEDATQAVFVLLCQRAKQMKREQKLAGWLFIATRYTARSIQRSRRRREHYENLAGRERAEATQRPPDFAGDLDDAVAGLPEADRAIVLLRFYRGLEFEAIAGTLGISAEAAKKRLSRAVGRLRARLGAGASAEAVMTAAAFGAPANPAALCAHVSQVAMAAISSGQVPAGIASALKGTGYLMAMTKLKVAAVVGIILLMGTGATVAVWQIAAAPAEPPMNQPAPAATAMDSAASTPTFEQAYALQPGEALRLVPRPYIPARLDFYRNYFRKQYPAQMAVVGRGPDAMLVTWRNGKPGISVSTFGDGTAGFSAVSAVRFVLGVYPQDLQVDKTFGRPRSFPIPGDFVVNSDATQAQLAESLGKIFSKVAGTPMRLVFRNVERPVIVFSGKWQQKRIAGVTPIPGRNPDAIEIYGLALNSNRSYSEGGDGPFSDFAGWLGEYIDKTVVFEATNLPMNPRWNENEQGDGTQESRKHAHDLDLVCRHICEQTGLTWSPETRTVRTLFIERGN